MKIKNDISLIGDLLGTVPVMIDLAKAHGGLEVYHTLDEGKWVYPLIPEWYGVKLVPEQRYDLELNISDAFDFGGRNGMYMSQCYHHQVGLRTLPTPPSPELDVPVINVPEYDYLLAPFSRSLGTEERWPIKKWEELGLELEQLGYSVAVLGNSKYDEPISSLNNEFDRPLVEVLNLIRNCRLGVISVVTGISHMCFAMGVKNYLLCNQGVWGRNPEAICVETYIPRITVKDMLEVLCEN